MRGPYFEADWRREQLRTNLWLVPVVQTIGIVVLFGITYTVDRSAYDGWIRFPSWVLQGSADSARVVLATVAASIITVVGIVFSITIVALTLASTQFGPRMLRNFVRDPGTQVALGTFVASFCYAMIALVSVGGGPHGDFVPHLSITVTFMLTLADVAVLIFFLNHIASMIQLPVVIARIAATLDKEITALDRSGEFGVGAARGPSHEELLARLADSGAPIRTPRSGYLQVIRHDSLLKIATKADAVIQLPYRPGHFVVAGQVIARVWPPEAAESVAERLALGHITGAYRTLPQDISFGFDQLVEIGLRALSPAVNDTFTGMTCVDWIADGLCRISTSWRPQRIRRDAEGNIRVIAFQPDFERLVERTFDTIRQAAVGMPAIMIRQLEALAKIMEQTPDRALQTPLIRQAEAIQQSSLATVADPSDRDDVTERYEAVMALVHPTVTPSTAEPNGASSGLAATVRRVTTELKADLVLSGGGVKGIGLSGAAVALMEAGYAIQRVSGTSAGSIVGAILAAGADELTPEQVEQLTMTLPYKKFLDPTHITGIPLLGPAWGVLSETGIYKGDYAHDWIRTELANLGVRTFGDLAIDAPNLPPEQRYRLVVTASDVTTGQLVRLPWDYHRLYGLDPDEQQVADAVRASMSIPFFFRTAKLTSTSGLTSTLVDGGMLSNFPIDSFDRRDGKPPRWPTFGVTLLPNLPQGNDKVIPALAPVNWLFGGPPLIEALITTMIVGRDQTYLNQPWVDSRAIRVDSSKVGFLDFNIGTKQMQELYQSGYNAADRLSLHLELERVPRAFPATRSR